MVLCSLGDCGKGSNTLGGLIKLHDQAGPFLQQIFIEYLLGARHCSRGWHNRPTEGMHMLRE